MSNIHLHTTIERRVAVLDTLIAFDDDPNARIPDLIMDPIHMFITVSYFFT